MKRVYIMMMAVVTMSFAACAQNQKKMGEMNGRGPRMGGGMMMNSKENDSMFVALKNEALGKFKIAAVRDWLFQQNKD